MVVNELVIMRDVIERQRCTLAEMLAREFPLDRVRVSHWLLLFDEFFCACTRSQSMAANVLSNDDVETIQSNCCVLKNLKSSELEWRESQIG